VACVSSEHSAERKFKIFACAAQLHTTWRGGDVSNLVQEAALKHLGPRAVEHGPAARERGLAHAAMVKGGGCRGGFRALSGELLERRPHGRVVEVGGEQESPLVHVDLPAQDAAQERQPVEAHGAAAPVAC